MRFTNVKGILSAQNGMNLYRGCTHGCIYCDARWLKTRYIKEFGMNYEIVTLDEKIVAGVKTEIESEISLMSKLNSVC